MTKGMILDIQKFSLHDGPGIRTTVFLKGCPLRCIWCHNPESQKLRAEIAFKEDKCVLCGACALACENNVHSVDEKHIVNYENCIGSRNCIEVCNYDALKLYGELMDVKDIIDEAYKDIKYYEKSGGGITISGGEPLMQSEFTLELLKAAKEKGIHTCIETCGFASREVIDRIRPYVDLFLYDYKASDEVLHEKLTGVSNKLIIDNFKYLYDQGASIILRCPLIPKINDSIEHLKTIADISFNYPLLKGIEILPYHNFGKGKWREIGKEYLLMELKNPGEDVIEKWTSFFNDLGCKNIKIG